MSQTVALPPNEAVTVNVTLPLRLYNEHKKVQCEGEGFSDCNFNKCDFKFMPFSNKSFS